MTSNFDYQVLVGCFPEGAKRDTAPFSDVVSISTSELHNAELRFYYLSINGKEDRARALHAGGLAGDRDFADIVEGAANPNGGCYQKLLAHALSDFQNINDMETVPATLSPKASVEEPTADLDQALLLLSIRILDDIEALSDLRERALVLYTCGTRGICDRTRALIRSVRDVEPYGKDVQANIVPVGEEGRPKVLGRKRRLRRATPPISGNLFKAFGVSEDQYRS